jgi:hypothetical protein
LIGRRTKCLAARHDEGGWLVGEMVVAGLGAEVTITLLQQAS